MKDGKEIYDQLKEHFLENGYIITQEGKYGMSAQHSQKQFNFEQMLEEEYLEAVLSLASDELLVQYDILDGEFSSDIFVESPESAGQEKEWRERLHDEVNLLKLKDFVM